MRGEEKQSLTIKGKLACCASCITLCLTGLGAIAAIYVAMTNVPVLDLLRFRMLGAPPLRLTGEFSAPLLAVVIPSDVNPSTLGGPDSILTWRNRWPRVTTGHPSTTIRLDIASLSMDEWVIIERTMLFRILDYQPLEDWVNVLGSEWGGGAYYRHFEVELAPPQSEDEIFRADFSPRSFGFSSHEPVPDYPSDEAVLDYFTLSPGEQEIFVSDVKFKEPGLYTFAVGIEYAYGGEKKTTWLKRSFTFYVPTKWYVWIGSTQTLRCQLLKIPAEDEGGKTVLGYEVHCEPTTK